MCLLSSGKDDLFLQSSDIIAGATITDNSNMVSEETKDQEVIVRYLDANPGTTVDYSKVVDKTFSGDYVADHDLERYLSRPISISTITWAEGANLNTLLQPWDLFFNTTQVRKKIDNYARLQCNLHVKVIINASPFYYGAGLVSYCPNTNLNPGTISSTLTVNGDAYTCCLSQRPHFWIYPQTNQGGELTLPFLNHRTWLNIGVRADFQGFGTLNITSPTALLNANSVVGAGVTVQVYAWATDVKLCGPTVALALQAGEYGAISGPASAVANIARKLSTVPFLAPYAKATEMVSSGIGAVAKLFGFTNAPIVEDVRPLKNLPFHAFSSCEISQPIDKLALDPKNELTIDSRVCGHDGVDELLLTNFIQRESYLLQATWTAAHTTGQMLIRSNVCPDLKIVETHTVPFIQGTPMSHAASLFRFWRGDIIYRFRFICSKFHRGRIKIQWDPQTQLTTAQDANLIHTQIVDISSDTDVEFRVPYLAYQMFLRGKPIFTDSTTYNAQNIVNTGALEAYNSRIHNGSISLSVLTQQTSPVASADIIILVSARAADNLVFGLPQNPPLQLSPFALQSEDVSVDSSSQGFNYDETKHYDLSTKPPVLDDETFLVCMGERITSLRQLLRRTTYHRSQLLTNSASTTQITCFEAIHARLPLAFGYDPLGINSTTAIIAAPAQVPFNFVSTTFITWISTCFVGFRGAINWHYNTDDSNFINSIRPIRYSGPGIGSNYNNIANYNSTNSNQFARSAVSFRDGGGEGHSLNTTRTQAGVSVQYPMYSPYRMNSTNVTTLVRGAGEDETDQDHCEVEINMQQHAATTSIPFIDFYVNAGTDFTCIFFINVPTLINYGALPAPIP